MINQLMKEFYLNGSPNGTQNRLSRGAPVYKGVSNSPVSKKFKNLAPAAKKRIRGKL